MKFSKRIIVFALILPLGFTVQAQETYRGKVVDAIHNAAIVGVWISKGTNKAGVTDLEGKFTIKAAMTGDTIEVSHLGYYPVQLILKPGIEFLNINLEPKTTQLNEVVIAAFNRKRVLLNEPAALSVLSPEDFKRNNDITITPFLNAVPGVYMHSGALNTNRITIRGIGSRSLFSTNKIKAYINEIPITTGDGETTIEDIALQAVDRVEVIKGPNSSSYGAGLGGAILFTSARSKYRESNFQADFTAGSFGQRRITLKAQHSDDHKNINIISNVTHSDGFRDNNKYDRKSIALIGNFYTGENNIIHVFGNFINLKAFIPSSLDRNTFENNPSAAAFTWQQSMGFEDYDKSLIGIAYEHTFNKQWHQTTSLFTGSRNAFELRPFNILTESTQSLGARSSVFLNSFLNDHVINWSLGMEYFTDWYNWQTLENVNRKAGALLSNNQEKRNYLNVFTQFEFQINSRSWITAGLNLNHTQYILEDIFAADSINQSGTYSFKTTLSPRVAILHKFNKELSLYLNLSHGFSPPTLAETLTPEGLINPNIKPESGYNVEVGARGLTWNKKLQFDLSVYHMFIKNLLVARRVDDDQFVGVNAGSTRHKGIEMQLNYPIIKNKNLQLIGYGNLSLTDYKFKDFVDGNDNYSGNKLTGNPAKIIHTGFDFKSKSGVYFHLNFKYIDKIPVNDNNDIYAEAYHLFNFKLGYNCVFAKSFSVGLSAGINNIFDEDYASMILINAQGFGGNEPRYYYPGLPRNYYTQIKLAYKLL